MHDPQLVRSRTEKWVRAVILQCSRILERPEPQHSDEVHAVGCDAHFLAISIAHLLYWLKQADRSSERCTSAIEAFEAELPDAKDVRDMLEHDGDYIIGGGRRQSGYLATINSGSTTINGVHPFTLVVSKEGHSVGGRIPVERTKGLAENLLTAL